MILIAIVGVALVVKYQTVAAEATAASAVSQQSENAVVIARTDYTMGASEQRVAYFEAWQDAKNRAQDDKVASIKASQRKNTVLSLIVVFSVAALLVLLLTVVGVFLYLAESKRSFEAQKRLDEIEQKARERGQEAVGPEGDPLELKALWPRTEQESKVITG